MTDFAADFAALVREVVPAVDAVAAERLEAELRRRYGGDRVLILERRPVTVEQINDRLRARVPVAAMVDDLGVSRATIYRMLGTGRRKKSQGRGA